MGCQSNTEEDMNTIPFLDTVAGEALSMLWGSNTTLQLGAMGILSPFASVSVLLSSSTLLKNSFSIKKKVILIHVVKILYCLQCCKLFKNAYSYALLYKFHYIYLTNISFIYNNIKV